MRRDPRAGFSLLELVVALSLASLVLVGVMAVAASMVRFQMEAVRKGSVTGGALVSFVKMAREIESANVMVSPSAGTDTDSLVVCNNWSRLMAPPLGAELNPSRPDLTEVLYYCYNPGATMETRVIWRYRTPGGPCPLAPPAFACDGTAFPDGTLMAYNVERPLGVSKMFSRDATNGAVRIRYVVGEQAPTGPEAEKHKVPVFIPFDLRLNMQKQYGNGAD